MLTLVLGGARSGKSNYAQGLCHSAAQVVYVATALRASDDAEMLQRITRHQADRPAEWRTVEEPLGVACTVREAWPTDAVVLVDCITVWLANLMWEHRALTREKREHLVIEQVAELADATRERKVILVSNEVGSGIVPDNPVGREFRDVQGFANQLLAREASRVVLTIAGLPLTLKDERG